MTSLTGSCKNTGQDAVDRRRRGARAVPVALQPGRLRARRGRGALDAPRERPARTGHQARRGPVVPLPRALRRDLLPVLRGAAPGLRVAAAREGRRAGRSARAAGARHAPALPRVARRRPGPLRARAAAVVDHVGRRRRRRGRGGRGRRALRPRPRAHRDARRARRGAAGAARADRARDLRAAAAVLPQRRRARGRAPDARARRASEHDERRRVRADRRAPGRRAARRGRTPRGNLRHPETQLTA